MSRTSRLSEVLASLPLKGMIRDYNTQKGSYDGRSEYDIDAKNHKVTTLCTMVVGPLVQVGMQARSTSTNELPWLWKSKVSYNAEIEFIIEEFLRLKNLTSLDEFSDTNDSAYQILHKLKLFNFPVSQSCCLILADDLPPLVDPASQKKIRDFRQLPFLSSFAYLRIDGASGQIHLASRFGNTSTENNQHDLIQYSQELTLHKKIFDQNLHIDALRFLAKKKNIDLPKKMHPHPGFKPISRILTVKEIAEIRLLSDEPENFSVFERLPSQRNWTIFFSRIAEFVEHIFSVIKGALLYIPRMLGVL